ncbi:MAG: hypothetical protein JWO38_7885 [Gemmataceae bacterium]|nr:hypothetical protein [Gemmataceae bacterium]
MGRRVVVLAGAVVSLVGIGIAGYTLLWTDLTPAHVEAPSFTPSAAPLPQTDEFAELAKTDPVAMFEACLTRYVKEAKGFRATLEKRERVQGKLHDREVIRVAVWGDVPARPGDQPRVRVRMVWDQGFQKDALGNEVRGTLYAEGENNNQVLTLRPGALVEKWSLDPKGSLARGASRYCVTDSGIYRGMLRTYTAWKKRKEKGELRTEYLGKEPVEKTGGRVCHIVRRTCARPEADSFALDEERPTDPRVVERDGATEITVMIDAERWLHIGTVLKKANGDLIGEYYFRDVEIAPEEFPAGTFTLAGLKAAVTQK